MRIFKFVMVAAAAVLVSACATKKAESVDPNANMSQNDMGPRTVQERLRQVGDTVNFDLDSYGIRPDAAAILQLQAQLLQENPSVMVRIEGHCDERGTREYNLALGDRRANAVKETLVSYGVDRNRISTISFGKDRPVCGEAQEFCWSQNRRGTTTIRAGAGS